MYTQKGKKYIYSVDRANEKVFNLAILWSENVGYLLLQSKKKKLQARIQE
jgi:hypothetical protein